MLVSFGVEGLVIPWKAPNFGKRRTYKDPRLRAWQTFIAHEAHKHWGKEPYDEPVELRLWCVKKDERKSWWGRWWRTRPDLDNIQKALADAVTGQALRKSRKDPPSPIGRILTDDNLIVKTQVHKQCGPKPGLWVEFYKVDKDGPELPGFFS